MHGKPTLRSVGVSDGNSSPHPTVCNRGIADILHDTYLSTWGYSAMLMRRGRRIGCPVTLTKQPAKSRVTSCTVVRTNFETGTVHATIWTETRSPYPITPQP